MKGKFFKLEGRVYQILSDAFMHPEGEVQVVAMYLEDNSVSTYDVAVIDYVTSKKENLY
jgi:hypothetical protein